MDRLYYVAGRFEDDEAYQRLQQRLVQIDQEHETRGNYFHYLATAPEEAEEPAHLPWPPT